MKVRIAFLVLALSLTAAISARADSIPRDGTPATSYNPGALADRAASSFIVTGFTGFAGSNYTHLVGGLYSGWRGTLLSGTLLNVLFDSNSSTVISTTKLAGHDNSPDLANASTTWHLNIFGRSSPDRSPYSHTDRSVSNRNIPVTIPEPGTLSLLGTGLVGVGNLVRRKGKLEKAKSDANRPVRLHSDGLHCVAQICLQGHLRSADGRFESGENCTKCGAACIDKCESCRVPIRGQLAQSPVQDYELPFFCPAPGCGLAYPWMEDKLDTARELLYDNKDLSLAEREELWNLLKFVICNPKSDWAPAKTKLVTMKLAKVSKESREFLLDFTAKVAAEVAKSQG
jgi:hypothetical protein